jgi:hypothetical protein
MSVRAMRDRKTIAPEPFVQRVVQGNLESAGAPQRNMIAGIEMRPDTIPYNAKEREQVQAKSKDVSEVARIAIKAKGRILFVDPIDVVAARAQGNYVALTHKSGLNSTLVRDLRRDSAGTYVLRTADGSEHPVARAHKDNLKVIVTSWLGVQFV